MFVTFKSSGNFGIWNWFRNKFGKKNKFCPVCATHGLAVKLKESNVLFVCVAVKKLQISLHTTHP